MKTLLKTSIALAFALVISLALAPQGISLTYGHPPADDFPTEGNPIWVYYICVDESGNRVDCEEESPPPEESDEPEEVPEEPPAETPDVVNQVTPSDPLYLEGSGSLFSGCTLQVVGSHSLFWNSLIFGALMIGVRAIRTLLRSD